MGFRYNGNVVMKDDLRVQNPLGFQVTDYRVDNDYAAIPAPPTSAIQQTPAATTGQQVVPGQAPAQQVPGQPMTQPAAPGSNGAMPMQQAPAAAPGTAPVYPGAQPVAAPPLPNAAPQNNGNGANVR